MSSREFIADRRCALAPRPPRRAAPPPSLLSVLRERGLRITRARRAVADVLDGARFAMSHADIDASLAEPIDRVTLYRTLDSFVDASVISKIVDADRVNRFMATRGLDHQRHGHFHCDDCGRVYCIVARPPRRPPVPAGFAVDAIELSLRGHCADCARAAH